MSVTRRAVLEQLAAESDAEGEETTTIEALASTLGVDEHTVEVHLNGLVACELARIHSDGGTRVTITGEELLELDADEMVIIDPATTNTEQ